MSQFIDDEKINTKKIVDELEVDLSYNTGTVIGYIVAGLSIVPGIILSIVNANNWTYEQAQEYLATEWTNRFEKNLRHRVSYEMGK